MFIAQHCDLVEVWDLGLDKIGVIGIPEFGYHPGWVDIGEKFRG